MKLEKTLKAGIYKIYWYSGGHSIAAVGVMKTGNNWLAPTNWVSPICEDMTIDSWDHVERVELITTQHAEDYHADFDRAMKAI